MRRYQFKPWITKKSTGHSDHLQPRPWAGPNNVLFNMHCHNSELVRQAQALYVYPSHQPQSWQIPQPANLTPPATLMAFKFTLIYHHDGVTAQVTTDFNASQSRAAACRPDAKFQFGSMSVSAQSWSPRAKTRPPEHKASVHTNLRIKTALATKNVMTSVAERLMQAYFPLLERACVGSIPANSHAEWNLKSWNKLLFFY